MKKKNKKVYCLDCEFMAYNPRSEITKDEPVGTPVCIKHIIQYNTWLKVEYKYISPIRKNKNNNCKDFEEKMDVPF